jgi:beta-xylosidase
LNKVPPHEHYAKPQHGNGVWAPAIRFHKNEFYIYYPDPDFGIFLIKSKTIYGPWSEPVLVEAGKGLIDPCPLWDTDGKAYLVHAFAGSRAGIKSIIVVKPMNADGSRITGSGVVVYDGHEKDPTIEGPKFYKRNGYYYIFAPAGGVATGWQTVLRSKSVYGPYERKVVLEQGPTSINGPHQGAWINTKTGEDWFIHFQDKGPYGRVVHLQPMAWKNNWPVIGEDKNADGTGNPVFQFKKPSVGKSYPITTPPDSDEFNGHYLSLQWQWHANPQPQWSFMTGNALRLYSYTVNDSSKNSWDIPNLLMQKLPAEKFTVTTKITFNPLVDGDRVAFGVMGLDYAYLSLTKEASGARLQYVTCKQADKGRPEFRKDLGFSEPVIYFRIKMDTGALCRFSYSTDNISFTDIAETFVAKEGKWIGAKVGYFCTRIAKTNDSGWADIDWCRIE